MTRILLERRDFLVALSSTLLPVSGLHASSTSTYEERKALLGMACQSLFSNHLPPTVHCVEAAVSEQLIAAVFEGEATHEEYGLLENRWLCLAAKSGSKISLEVFENALHCAGYVEETRVGFDLGNMVHVYEKVSGSWKCTKWQRSEEEWAFKGLTFIEKGTLVRIEKWQGFLYSDREDMEGQSARFDALTSFLA